MNGVRSWFRLFIILSFIVVIYALLVWSRISAYSIAPTMEPQDFSNLPWYEIPIYYLYDYFSHGTICLLFAFTTAGLVYEFAPKNWFIRYMRSSRLSSYILGAAFAPLFTVCSCTMIPIFAGILYSGAGIGPAITFLLMAPAANVLTILVTGEFISWDVAGARFFASLVTALFAGIIISRTAFGKKVEEEKRVGLPQDTSNVEEQSISLDERLVSALRFGGFLAKQILPYFIVGLIVVGYVTAYTPEELVEGYLTGVRGVLLASVIGGPLYTPTLVEVVLGRSLLSLGMSKAALLSWLMGQPYDIPNMMATSKVVGWKVVLSYAAIAWACSVSFGTLYGVITSSL
ncbi:MAG: permease [Nitrososphaeria archaeon]|nr:permease [Nitrososphaeria archaeon]